MKIQISRFSTHQTAKVFALLMAASSLLFMIPFILISLFASVSSFSEDSEFSMTVFSGVFLFMPVFQGLMGYFMVRFGLWVYNVLSPKIGGFEFEYEKVGS